MSPSDPSGKNPDSPDPNFDPDATVNEETDFDPDATVDELAEIDPDATVEEVAVVDLNATVEETLGFDPDATVIEGPIHDPDATVEEVADIAPDATVADTAVLGADISDLDATVEDASDFDPDATRVEDAPNATSIESERNTVANLKTVASPNLNETAENLANDSVGDSQPSHNATDQNATIDTEDDHGTAILDSTDLNQTINPKSLSKAESEYWNGISAEFTSPSHPTSLPPAIDRTIVETRLQLRSQSVATKLQGDQEDADYRLVRLLGRGGMGNVFVARQGSLDRLIAVKVIRPLEKDKKERLAAEGKLEKVEQGRRQQFLTEAVVTGDLDHPNIVPIHDIALTGDSTLFYSMKRVVGTPWLEVIDEKSRDENLEILIKVADAIGFAHTRGVIHRDIKPENVMLGDFGVVMVMDWGIALAKPEFEKLDSITPATGLGGTPSMMAPEMAIGPIERIGPAADIYLLGATLFMIITGKPPHQASNVSMCLQAVASNTIRDIEPDQSDELMDIALKAMATRPEDRYLDTKEFQDAIREYRSHSESIALATRATEELENALANQSYAAFSRSRFGFEQSIELWTGNQRAQEGLHRNLIAHAEAAYQNGDYELGLGLLSDTEPSHAELISRLRDALRQRLQREARFGLLKKVAAALLTFILLGGSAAFYAINEARTRASNNAMLARRETRIAADNLLLAVANENQAKANAKRADANAEQAEENAAEAEANFELAEANRLLAVENERAAKLSEQAAIESEAKALDAQARAEYESYVSKIGLAKARIDRNEFSEARRLLDELTQQARNQTSAENSNDDSGSLPWEIRYLSSIANQATRTAKTESSVAEISFPVNDDVARDRTEQSNKESVHEGLVRFDNGLLAKLSVNHETSKLTLTDPIRAHLDRTITSIAMSQDGRIALLGMDDGDIQVRKMDDLFASPQNRANRTLSDAMSFTGHRARITHLQMLDEEHFLSSSSDRTVRIWNIAKQTNTETLWHIAPVVDVSAASIDNQWLIAAAVSESRGGQIVVWKSDRNQQNPAQQLGFYSPHKAGLTCVSISPDGKQVASGDSAGEIMLWPITEAQQQDTTALVNKAVQSVTAEQTRPDVTSKRSPYALTPYALKSGSSIDFGISGERSFSPAHSAPVRRLHFATIESRETDSTVLLSCSDDYLVSVWHQVNPASDAAASANASGNWVLKRQLRGHGGPVSDANFVDEDKIVSAGLDQNIQLWSIASTRPNMGKVAISTEERKRQTSFDAPEKGGDGTFRQSVHRDPILAAKLSPDGSRIATASRDRTAKLLSIDPELFRFDLIASLKDEEDAKRKTFEEGSSFRAMSMSVSSDGKSLFVGGADSVIRVWNIQRGTELSRLTGTGLNQVFAASSNAQTLLTGSDESDVSALVWQWDPANRRSSITHRLRGHEETVAAFAISADGQTGLTGDRAGRVIVWNLDSGEPIGRPIDRLLGTRVNDLVFAGDAKHAWIAADDGNLSQVEWKSGKLVNRLEHDGFVTRAKLSDDGRFALTMSELQKVGETIHEATLWQLSDSLETSAESGLANAKAPSSTLLKFSVKAGTRTLGGGRPGITAIDLDSTTSKAIVAYTPAGDRGSRIAVWGITDDASQSPKETEFRTPTQLGDVSSIVGIQDKQLITLHGSSAFRWHIPTGRLRVSYRTHGAITSVAFSPDGELLATGSRSLKLWDVQSGTTLGKLESPHEGTIRAITFAPAIERSSDARAPILTGGEDGTIRVWKFDQRLNSFTSAGQIETMAGYGNPLSLSLSPDGKHVLSTTDRGQVVIHSVDLRASAVGGSAVGGSAVGGSAVGGNAVGGNEVVGSQPTVLLNAPEVGEILAGCFSPDGNSVATGGDDRLIRVWDLNGNGTPVVCQGHAQTINAVAISGTTGQLNWRIFSAGQDRSVRIWDPKDPTAALQARELLELVSHEDGVTAIDLTPSETMMMTAGRDGNVILWPAE